MFCIMVVTFVTLVYKFSKIYHLKQVKFGPSRENLPWILHPGKVLIVNTPCSSLKEETADLGHTAARGRAALSQICD